VHCAKHAGVITACQEQWPGWACWIQSSPYGWVGSTKKTLKLFWAWASNPTGLIFFGLRVWLAKQALLDIRKFHKNSAILWIYLWVSRIFFCWLCYIFDLWIFTVNVNVMCDTCLPFFLFFFLKQFKNKKIFFFSFNPNFADFILWRKSQEYHTFWVTQYLLTSELRIFIGEYSLIPESRIL